jgi:hypothetical protein
MASEGIMFDWRFIFKDVVKAPGELIVLGYFIHDYDVVTDAF